LKRYLVTFYTNDNTSEEAHNARVVSKINECLRRPVQPNKGNNKITELSGC
jgi:hypothetical protein